MHVHQALEGRRYRACKGPACQVVPKALCSCKVAMQVAMRWPAFVGTLWGTLLRCGCAVALVWDCSNSRRHGNIMGHAGPKTISGDALPRWDMLPILCWVACTDSFVQSAESSCQRGPCTDCLVGINASSTPWRAPPCVTSYPFILCPSDCHKNGPASSAAAIVDSCCTKGRLPLHSTRHFCVQCSISQAAWNRCMQHSSAVPVWL